jgi:hypothetical protein
MFQVSNEKDPIVFMSAPRSPPRSFLQVGLPDTLLSVSKLGVVGAHSWHPHDRHGLRGFTLDVDPTINNAKYVMLEPHGRAWTINLKMKSFTLCQTKSFYTNYSS